MTNVSKAGGQTHHPLTGKDDGGQNLERSFRKHLDQHAGQAEARSLHRNAGGVLQAAATQGVSPASTQVKSTGSGPMMTYNVTNATSRTQSYTYTDTSRDRPMTITLKPGETGTFQAPATALGVRVSPSSPTGTTHPNEVIFENGATLGQSGSPTQNVDVSKVDGSVGYDGTHENLTVTLGDGRTAGDGDKITPYLYPTDDAAAMGLAGDASLTANMVFS